MANEKYEYKKVSVQALKVDHYTNLDMNKLNVLGEDGWELILIASGEAIFKRPLGWGFRV